MSKRILFIAAFFITGLASYDAVAQINPNVGDYDPGMRPEFRKDATPEELAKEQTRWMYKELALNSDTSKKVYQINLKYEQMYREQLNNSPDMTDYDKVMLTKIRNEQNLALKALLTEQQWALLQVKMKSYKPTTK